MEVGAGTFHRDDSTRSGPRPLEGGLCAALEAANRRAVRRNPNRLQHYYQYQAILKPSPDNSQDLYLDSLRELGVPDYHDIRFVEDDWESPTLGASGLGWEVWCDGMEVTQFTYFQQVGGIECHPVAVELTYGLERLAMYTGRRERLRPGFQRLGRVLWRCVPARRSGILRLQLRTCRHRKLFRQFEFAEAECHALLAQELALPAYDQCIKASHVFNLLDARNAISVTERATYIGRVRALAKGCRRGSAYMERRKRPNSYA